MYMLEEFLEKSFPASNYEVVKVFNMLHTGWECDYEVCLVKVDGDTYAVGSNHGSPCFLSKKELAEKAKEYTEVLGHTVEAISVISEPE